MPGVRTPCMVAVAAGLLAIAACTTTRAAGHPAARPSQALSSAAPSASADPVGPSTPAASPSPRRSTLSGLPGATRPGTIPPVVNNGPRIGNRVALTFDADMTDAMLKRLAADPSISFANRRVIDILEQTRTPATFFLTGEWVETYPDVARRLAADPRFELGNHTYRHQAFKSPCYTLPPIAPENMTEDVARTFRIIAPLGGRQTRYFRFPGLCYDDVALRALAPLGVTVVQGDVVSGDPYATAAPPIIHAVLTRVHPGSIVVMHITEANAQFTDEALQPILDGLRARGLRPVTLSELLR